VPIDVEPLICKTCKLFALAPRQCINCFNLVCSRCVQKSGDSKNCPTCKSQGGKPNSLDNPNVLNDATHTLLDRISFVCPNSCGVKNLEMLEVNTHLLFFCEKGNSENKQEIMGRMYWLKELLAKQRKEHNERITKLKD